VAAVLSVTSDAKFLQQIKAGYDSDEFTKKLATLRALPPGITKDNSLWFIDGCLLIPRTESL
ncbi:hypothetical protein BDZ89DRAFT_914645, partial [Hymenopellis radicata]